MKMENINGLKLWDGTVRGSEGLKYDTSGSGWVYYIDSQGTVYYAGEDDLEPHVWCPAARLVYHVVRLNQILGR